MKSILGLDIKQTQEIITNTLDIKNFPVYRIKQIFEWIYKKGVFDFNSMSNLPLDFRNKLTKEFIITTLELNDEQVSKDKQAHKYVFKTRDEIYVETVRIIHPDRQTLCISTMAGCPLNCTFCATAKMGYTRSLDAGEIISQILILHKIEPCNNVVFMGMGEPLLNTENVFRTIELLSAKEFLNFSARRFTISTAGVIKGINGLIDFNKKVNLAVSLNSPFQKEREKIMPVAKNNPLNSLYIALKKYNEKCGRFTFEYIILPGVNNSEKHAKAIISLKKDLNFNVNIIAYNDFPGAEYKKCTSKDINAFLSYFKNSNVEAVKRVSKGADILAACGQLAGKK